MDGFAKPWNSHSRSGHVDEREQTSGSRISRYSWTTTFKLTRSRSNPENPALTKLISRWSGSNLVNRGQSKPDKASSKQPDSSLNKSVSFGSSRVNPGSSRSRLTRSRSSRSSLLGQHIVTSISDPVKSKHSGATAFRYRRSKSVPVKSHESTSRSSTPRISASSLNQGSSISPSEPEATTAQILRLPKENLNIQPAYERGDSKDNRDIGDTRAVGDERTTEPRRKPKDEGETEGERETEDWRQTENEREIEDWSETKDERETGDERETEDERETAERKQLPDNDSRPTGASNTGPANHSRSFVDQDSKASLGTRRFLGRMSISSTRMKPDPNNPSTWVTKNGSEPARSHSRLSHHYTNKPGQDAVTLSATAALLAAPAMVVAVVIVGGAGVWWWRYRGRSSADLPVEESAANGDTETVDSDEHSV